MIKAYNNWSFVDNCIGHKSSLRGNRMIILNSLKRIRRSLTVLFVTSLILGLVSCGGTDSPETVTNYASVDATQPVSDWKMVWEDEFDGAAIDSDKWTHEIDCTGGGNQEKQCYTDNAENSFVSGGMLSIVALPAAAGAEQPYTSARLNTKYKADFKYGRIEMRAQLPEGQGTHPAFWMLSTDETYGTWPRSGEIDIIEAVNLNADRQDGSPETYVHGTLWYGGDFNPVTREFSNSGKAYLPTGNPTNDFHTYAIEWNEGEIRWYVDDYLFQTQRAST
ncbi:MAG: beta-glucanase (GH16 family), partial [Enterobacterales bacterium]